MIAFKRLDLTRRQEVFDWFHRAGRLGCEYSFVNLYLWGQPTCRFCGGVSGGVLPFLWAQHVSLPFRALAL